MLNKPEYLFVLKYDQGELDPQNPNSVTLKNIHNIKAFSNRPFKNIIKLENEEFVDLWNVFNDDVEDLPEEEINDDNLVEIDELEEEEIQEFLDSFDPDSFGIAPPNASLVNYQGNKSEKFFIQILDARILEKDSITFEYNPNRERLLPKILQKGYLYVDSRSLKKGPFIAESLHNRAEKMKTSGTTEVIKTWSIRSTITPDFVGHTLQVHNGKTFIPVNVHENMVGHKLGE
ncbi:Ribosomal protein S19 [seawater metagenome]|uniref:Ribosomal protein S19 n=1 Tax=seawater metagenome TaxID=1561972 RepID=A0A5E8CHF1_9ZZZZ